MSFKLSVGLVSVLGLEAVTNEAIAAFKPNPRVDTRFLYYALPEFVPKYARENIYGAKLLNQDLIASAKTFVPPLEEQRRIAAFLDYETRRIDELVSELEKFAFHAEERRAAIIVAAVTGALRLTECGSNSGSRAYSDSTPKATREALQSVPRSWDVARVADIASRRREFGTPDMDLLSVFLDRGVVPYVMDGGQVHAPSDDLSTYQVVRRGDLVLNNQQAWRGSVGVSNYEGIISPAYVVLKLHYRQHPGFMNYLVRSKVMVHQFEIASRGVGDIQRQVYWPRLRECLVPLPSLEEQQRICDFLDHEVGRLNTLLAEQARLISLLRERRSALITSAVTGQIDVREWSPTDDLAVEEVA